MCPCSPLFRTWRYQSRPCLPRLPCLPCLPCFEYGVTGVSPVPPVSNMVLPPCPLSPLFRVWRYHCVPCPLCFECGSYRGRVTSLSRLGFAPSLCPLSPLFRIWRFQCIPPPLYFECGVTTVSPFPSVLSVASPLCPLFPAFRIWRYHGQVTSLSRRGPPSREGDPIDGVTFLQGDATDPAVLQRVITDGGFLLVGNGGAENTGTHSRSPRWSINSDNPRI